jgi:CheY-like chemotaxis protein
MLPPVHGPSRVRSRALAGPLPRCGRLLGSDCDRIQTSSIWRVRHLKGTAMTADGRQPHILIVNDTQEILDLLRELLEEEGYRVSTFVETLTLTRLKMAKPDVIIQDLLFEGMQDTGWMFFSMSRLDPDLAPVPLILCTAAVSVVKGEDMAAQLRIEQTEQNGRGWQCVCRGRWGTGLPGLAA